MKSHLLFFLLTGGFAVLTSCGTFPASKPQPTDDYFYFSGNSSDVDVSVEDGIRRGAQKMCCLDQDVFLYGNVPSERSKSVVDSRLNKVRDILVKSGIDRKNITVGTSLPSLASPANEATLYSRDYIRAIYTTQPGQ